MEEDFVLGGVLVQEHLGVGDQNGLLLDFGQQFHVLEVVGFEVVEKEQFEIQETLYAEEFTSRLQYLDAQSSWLRAEDALGEARDAGADSVHLKPIAWHEFTQILQARVSH